MKNSNFNFKLVPLGIERLGVIIGTPENEGRFILHCSSHDSVNTLVDALYYMNPSIQELDPSGAVKYYVASAEETISPKNAFRYKKIENDGTLENSVFYLNYTLIDWRIDNYGPKTKLQIVPAFNGSDMVLLILADVLSDDPEHYEWIVGYKEFCAAVANGCKTAIEELGVKGYERQTGKKKPDWKRINFLLNVATE